MAEGGPQGPAPHRDAQVPQPPQQPPLQLLHPQQAQQAHMHMKWFHFKPEYSGKPEEDVEAHLLRTND